MRCLSHPFLWLGWFRLWFSTRQIYLITAATYIDHAFSFALMNSEMVRKGSLATNMTVVLSSLLGPSSPAGKISICITSMRREEGSKLSKYLRQY